MLLSHAPLRTALPVACRGHHSSLIATQRSIAAASLSPALRRQAAASRRRCRLAPISAQGGAEQPGVLDDLRSSLAWGPQATSVRSWPFCLVCFLAAAGSLTTFNLLAAAIADAAAAGGFQGDPATLGLLDLRGGYTPEEVAATLSAWGPTGRGLYLAVEAIDVTCYCAAYRGVLLALSNRFSGAVADRWPGLEWARLAAVLPFILAGTDQLEDSLQVTATLTYAAAAPDASASPAWQALVGAASLVNQTKWGMVAAFSTALGLLACGAAAAVLLPRPQQEGE